MNSSELQHNAYTPYSNQPVAAVVQSENGTLFAGVRVENISFPLTISAIQNAVYCCISEGFTPKTLFIDSPSERDPMLDYWTNEMDLSVASMDDMESTSFSPIIRDIKSTNVLKTLQQLLGIAKVTHSNFPVAALLQTSHGFIQGVNIEPSDWSKGLCAERVALAKALSYGYTHFNALHIHTRHGEYSSPCGACRQVIIEHLPHQPVHLYHADGSQSMHFSSDLLPYSFQSSTLQKN